MNDLFDLQLFAEEISAESGDTTGVSPADAAQGSGETAADAGRKTWNEVKAEYKNEFDAEVRSIVQGRVKTLRDTIGRMEQAEELRAEAMQAQSREQAETARARGAVEHFDGLVAQAAALKETIPGFDLTEELKNDSFFRMTVPGSPVSVEQAYWALHPEYRRKELETVAKQAAEAVASSVKAGQARPTENGTQAASVSRMPHKSWPKEEREALKKRIKIAKAQGYYLKYGE